MLSNPNLLFASLIWSSVGLGYLAYGKRQQSISALVGGVLMLVASYFAESVLIMSLICVGVMFGVYMVARQGL